MWDMTYLALIPCCPFLLFIFLYCCRFVCLLVWLHADLCQLAVCFANLEHYQRQFQRPLETNLWLWLLLSSSLSSSLLLSLLLFIPSYLRRKYLRNALYALRFVPRVSVVVCPEIGHCCCCYRCCCCFFFVLVVIDVCKIT